MRTPLVVLFCLATCIVMSAQALPPGVRGPAQGGMLTRSASKYDELESRIVRALQERTAAALTPLVAPDFEVWSAEQSGSTSRDGWQRAGFAARVQSFRIRELTIRELGPQAVVSFLLEQHLAGRPTPSIAFVVDIWDTATDVLRVRYVSIPGRPVPADGSHK